MKEFKNISKLYQHGIFWGLTILSIKILGSVPQFIELVYAHHIYPVIAVVNRWFASFFPFSIGDLLYFWGFSYLLYQILQLVIQIKYPKEQFFKISTFLLKTIWIFYLSWGLNYFRQPLAKNLHLSTVKYTATQLLKVTDSLIARTNRLQKQLTGNDSLAVEIPYSIDNILQKTPEGYRQIESYIQTKYSVPCIKTSLFSKQISYMRVSGYLNPFTGEAQVNKFYPKVFLPDIASHEVAHQLGFAPENEANFLGYLAATHHPDLYFNYSGNIDALYYFLVELRHYNTKIYKTYLKKLHKGVLKNFKQAQIFHQKYRFPIDFSSTYDSYLKLNNQKSGIHSYNEMVQLVIAYELQKENDKTL